MKRSSVSLDEETHAIAKRMGNFSAFVRDCLRRWNAYDTGTHIQQESRAVQDGKKCYPRHRKGCCVICWPDGAPHHDDWMYYVDAWKTNPESANLWIEEKAKEVNITRAFPISQETTFNYKRKSRETLGVKAHLASFLRAIFRRRQ